MQARTSPAKATRSSQLAEDIRQTILSGRMQPGTKINLDRMRAAYGVSLSPLREAVARLTHTGLVEFEDQRGYRIAGISPENLAEVTRLRVELESLALALAIERAGLEWEAEVMAALHRLTRADRTQPDAWDAACTAFHQTLVDGADMPILSGTCGVLLGLNERYRRILAAQPSDDHAAIAEAAAVRRDANLARALLRDHIERGGACLARRLEEYRPSPATP